MYPARILLYVILLCTTVLLSVQAEEDIYDAAEHGNLDRVKEILKKGPEQVNKEDPFGLSTPLDYAAGAGHIEVCRFLIDNGADIHHIQVSTLWTPLHNAAYNAHTDVCELLLSNGAKADIFTEAALGHIKKLKQRLKKNPSDINKKQRNGTRPLDWAVAGHQPEMCTFLIKKGAHVNLPDTTDCSPALELAASRGHIDIAGILLKNGAHVNSGRAQKDYTPLHNAANHGREEMCRFLISEGADVNALTKHGTSPLYLAVEKEHIDICRILLDNGADVNAKDNHGWTVLDRALRSKHDELITLIKEHGGVSGREKTE
ncbi:MAG: hypothetical protein GF350_07210 [Chitinivibrionales bacterium]|nr:hypothetical protein [Chitinivibrionales bacterium]